MSAECSKHGCDLVYPAGSWPLGECPECVLDAAVGARDDALRRILMWASPVGADYDFDTALCEIRRICREALK